MPKRPDITQEDFDSLLRWLNPDREQAGVKYESIRQSLIKIFTWRGRNNAEDLADETINRVIPKVSQMTDYRGDPAHYFFAVAKRLFLEEQRQAKTHLPLLEIDEPTVVQPEDESEEESLREYECLRRCMKRLDAATSELVLIYYLKDKQPKIDNRKALAQKLGITINTLRVRMHRIRTVLEACIKECLEKPPPDETE